MVMGGDSCSEGCGFESRHHIFDGHFFTCSCKNCIDVCLKRPKINDKRGRVGPFLETNPYLHCVMMSSGASIGSTFDLLSHLLLTLSSFLCLVGIVDEKFGLILSIKYLSFSQTFVFVFRR